MIGPTQQPAAAAVHGIDRRPARARRTSRPKPTITSNSQFKPIPKLGRDSDTTSASPARPTAEGAQMAHEVIAAARPSTIDTDADVTMIVPIAIEPDDGADQRGVEGDGARLHDGAHARQLQRRAREQLAALAIVAEHVLARARRRQQHGVAALRERCRSARRHRPCSSRARVLHTGSSTRSSSAAAAPISTAARSLPRAPAASGRRSWPLLKPPAISTSGPASPCSAASVAPTFVPFESSTNVTPPRSGNALAAMRQARERAQHVERGAERRS